MRNLTIKRAKSFVGCLAKMKIYVENPTSGELTINNISCSKIGELKNGEEKTFQIEEQALKVFVIADKLSKNYCNEFYQLSAGQEDVFLSGKNHLKPANGNAFRFDNNECEAVLLNRKHSSKIGLIVLSIAIIVGCVAGYFVGHSFFSNERPKEKVFSSNGINITLSEEFKQTKNENYTVVFDSKEVTVFALREPFTLAEGFGNNTLDQYADLIIQSNNLSADSKKTSNGLICIEYDFTNIENNCTYHYFTYVFKTNDAFWLVQFTTLKENVERYSQNIKVWANSVSFSN